MINYYRFCCRIRIADEYAEEVPGGEFLAVEDGRASDRRTQFADARINDFSDWFHASPALLAHIRALTTGRDTDVRRRLIPATSAALHTGRQVQVLYQWRNEGRVSQYSVRENGRSVIMFDLLELPAAGSAPPRAWSAQKNLGPTS